MRSRWWILIYALVAVLIVLSLGRWGTADRPWHNCQESLIQQMFSDECTPRRGIRLPPANQVPGLPPQDQQTPDPY
ncbi:MAG: hypothetical protein MJE68_13855 [Proteobacteria bacterium]|nr:hypothetical protein [Pseudomonadota bacterium]